MAKDSGFDRDFGYLLPFLDKVAAASQGLSPEARAELQRLLAGEKEKWRRIREVLAGAPAAPSSAASRGPTQKAPPSAPRKPTTAPELPATLTVGSLRGS